MILSDFFKALAQLGDPRFRAVLFKGIGLSIVLLFAIYAAFVGVIGWLVPDTITLPWIGDITWVDNLLSVGSVFLMLGLSVFLMVPVASAFTGIFLDDVADAVEDRHFPSLSKAPSVSIAEGLRDGLSFLGLLIIANILASVLYLVLPPFAPVIFWGLNGFLLGREYFQLVAIRRLGRAGAKRMWRENIPQIWLAGGLMAVPLTVPLLNLLVPVLGAATFTHLYHRLARAPSVQTSRDRAR